MKNKKTRLIALLVSAVLLIGVGVGVLIASGAESGASAKIGSRNVIYDEKMCFAVQILDQNVDEQSETLGLLFWNEDVDLATSELKVSNATSVSYKEYHDAKADVYYYCTSGIAPDSVFDEVRFAACVKNNVTGAISIISEISSYSIAQYIGTRVIADNVTHEQTVLYEKVFNYGNAAMSVLKDGDYDPTLALVHTVGGTVGTRNYATYGGYLDASVTINAPEYNAAGDAFHGWEFGGLIVSRETTFDVKIGVAGIHTYTAIYGDTDIPDAGEGDPIYPTAPELYKAEVMSAKGGADGIVVLIHDDGNVSTVQTIDAIYQTYGLVGDMALTQKNAVADTSTWQSFLNTNRWKVVSHSATHTYWGTYDTTNDTNDKCDTADEAASHFNKNGTCKGDNKDKLYAETVGAQQALRDLFPGQRVLTFAYPGFSKEEDAFKSYEGSSYHNFNHVRSATSRALIEKHYISARAGLNFGVDIDDPESTWNTKYKNNRYLDETVWNYFPAYSWGYDNVNTIVNAVNKAANNGELAVIYCHKVEENPTTTSNMTTADDYRTVASLVSGYVNEGKVWNTHYEDAVLYVREATTSTLNVKSADETGMVVSLTDMMDDSIYDMALTVRVNVPAEWEAVKVTQNGKVSYAYCEFIDGVWTVDTEIVPDRGDATITPITAEQIEAETTYDLKAEATLDFNSGLQGAYITNSQTSTTLAATSMGSRTVLSLDKSVAASDGGRLLLPLGKTVSDAETIEVSFDIYLDNVADIDNGRNIFRTFFNTDTNKSPYDMFIINKGTGFTLGDSSKANGFGKVQSYGEWHNVKLVLSVGDRSTDSFLATIYVNGKAYGESTTYYGSADGLVASDVLGFYMYAQKSATFDMYIDDFYMRAYSGPDKKAPTEVAPLPELDSTDSWSFDNGTENVTASTAKGSVTSAQVLGKDAVTLGKVSGGGSQFTFPLSATVQPEVLKLSFDMYFHHTAADDINYSKNNAAFRFYQNTTYRNSPYSGSIHTYNGGTASDISDDYFTIGDASTATSSGKEYVQTNTALGGHLNFNEWYNIELIIHIGDGTVADFYAVWYVNGEFYGYSTNFYNEDGITPTPETATNQQANSLYIYALSSTVFTVSFDNVEISAYNDALKVEPSLVKTWDFEDADALDVTMTTSDKTNNTYSAATIDGHNAVKLSTLTKDYNVKWKMPLDGAHSVSEVDVQFDLYLSSENISGSFLAYLFLKESYSDAPYAGMLYADENGFSIKNRASTNKNTSQVTDIGGTISYDEWHTIRLVVETGSGDKSKFLATWYVDGEVYGTSTIFWTSDASETVPTSVDSLYIFAQTGVTFEAYIDNLTYAIYDIAN